MLKHSCTEAVAHNRCVHTTLRLSSSRYVSRLTSWNSVGRVVIWTGLHHEHFPCSKQVPNSRVSLLYGRKFMQGVHQCFHAFDTVRRGRGASYTYLIESAGFNVAQSLNMQTRLSPGGLSPHDVECTGHCRSSLSEQHHFQSIHHLHQQPLHQSTVAIQHNVAHNLVQPPLSHQTSKILQTPPPAVAAAVAAARTNYPPYLHPLPPLAHLRRAWALSAQR